MLSSLFCSYVHFQRYCLRYCTLFIDIKTHVEIESLKTSLRKISLFRNIRNEFSPFSPGVTLVGGRT